MKSPQVYAVEKNGNVQYFFIGGGYDQTMPLTWEALAERIEQHVNNYPNHSIIMRLPKTDLENLVRHEQMAGAKASLKTYENGVLELTRNGSVYVYRVLDGDEVSRLPPAAQYALYLSDGKTPAFWRTRQHL